MKKRKDLRYNTEDRQIVQPTEKSALGLFDLSNPDIHFFNLVDDETIRLGGSEVLVYRYHRHPDIEDTFEEDTDKIYDKYPIVLVGHYDPRPVEEAIDSFGLEISNDQTFTFNRNYIEGKLHRPIWAGDLIRPRFQNLVYEVFEVQEDSFEAYGVYHLICSARLHRDIHTLHQYELLDEPVDE